MDYHFVDEKPDGMSLWKNTFDSQTVAVKQSENKDSFDNELSILVELMCRNFDAYHILKFHGCFPDSQELAFETYDINLVEYMLRNKDTLTLTDVREIIQQVVTALAVLKAPERSSGLPFSAAADMWSLGHVMVFLVATCAYSEEEFHQLLNHPEDNDEGAEFQEFMQLLAAMKIKDPKKRITEYGVLNHPFILRGSYPWKDQYPPSVNDDFSLDLLNFEMMQMLGNGCFGELRKCWNAETGELVAVKRQVTQVSHDMEIQILQELMDVKADQHNIIKCHGWLNFKIRRAPVFELLDKTLFDIILEMNKPMALGDVRAIIQQMADALEFLKKYGLIHTDIKLDNIMTVDQQRPLRVKLIDFGLAMHRSQAELGMMIQPRLYRAPEVFFGLPISEAVDMWSLGCVMIFLIRFICGFIGDSDEDVVFEIVRFCGMPPDHLLNMGIYSTTFFMKTESNKWRHNEVHPLPTANHQLFLNDLKIIQLKENNQTEEAETEQCFELLKAMLEMDVIRRITPQEVLKHPFITPASCSKTANSPADHCSPPPTTFQPDAENEGTKKKKKKNLFIKRVLPSGICKCFLSTTNNSPQADVKSQESLQNHAATMMPGTCIKSTPEKDVSEPAAGAKKDLDSKKLHPEHSSPPTTLQGVIIVQPAPPDKRLSTVDNERPDSLQNFPEKMAKSAVDVLESTTQADSIHEDSCSKTGNPHPDQCSPPPPTSGGDAILVQPDVETEGAEKNKKKNKKKRNVFLRFIKWVLPSRGWKVCQSSATNSPQTNVKSPESLQNHAATMMPGTCIKSTPEKDVSEPAAGAKKDLDSKKLHPEHSSPPTTLQGVIIVQPAPPDKRLSTVDNERPDSLQNFPEKMAKSAVDVLESTTQADSIHEDSCSKTGNPHPDQCSPPPPTSGGDAILVQPDVETEGAEKNNKKKNKKKRNVFLRFIKWVLPSRGWKVCQSSPTNSPQT
ncbi:homeodomain-interacting protein kinase 2-like [Brachionichthys hirsutus]|uniref:homeodomain-interacting protein kinase 2-like n=1 Tax=Brachionichthys hirsutus TaxID=412623 RepID=UPI0036048365